MELWGTYRYIGDDQTLSFTVGDDLQQLNLLNWPAYLYVPRDMPDWNNNFDDFQFGAVISGPSTEEEPFELDFVLRSTTRFPTGQPIWWSYGTLTLLSPDSFSLTYDSQLNDLEKWV